MTTMFFTNIDLALRFYAICERCKITDEKERADLMMKLVRKDGTSSACHTDRTKEEIIKGVQKNYGNVMRITGKETK